MLIEFYITGRFYDESNNCLRPLVEGIFNHLTVDVPICPDPSENIVLYKDGFCIAAEVAERFFSYDAPEEGQEGRASYVYELGSLDIVEYDHKYEETIQELKEKGAKTQVSRSRFTGMTISVTAVDYLWPRKEQWVGLIHFF